MKKNFLGLFAIVLAIGLSAFTTVTKNTKPLGTPYFWYQVSGTNTTSNKLNSTTVDKAAAMSTLTPCDDLQTANCLYGSTNANLPIGSAIGTPAQERLIKKN